MRFLFFLLLPLLTLGQTELRYDVFYSENLEKEGLKVTVEFKHESPQDSTELYLTNRAWGENNLFNSVRVLERDNPDTRFELIPEKYKLVFYHPKSKKVKLTYWISQDYDDEKDYRTFNRPRVKNQFFSILGHSLFAVPFELTTKKGSPELNIEINWENFPQDFKIHNSFDSDRRKQKFQAKLWEELYQSLFVGGDYRIYEFDVQQKPVYFAIRGNWLNDFTDKILLENLTKSIQIQREFWDDYEFDYYTVIMSPTVTQNDSLYMGSSNTGSGLKNGFMIQATNNPFNHLNNYKYLLYHEMMHDWIGQRIRNQNEELNYWFSEGFTDYYTYKNRLRSEDISFEEWLNSFNEEVIKAHWKNPQKNIPNYRIKDDFWKSRDVEKVPYRRGAIFAFWLDNQIILKSNGEKSLDNLMRQLIYICKQENKLFSDELFITLSNEFLNTNISYFFQKHIISGEDIDLINEKWIDGVHFELKNDVPQIIISKKPDYIF